MLISLSFLQFEFSTRVERLSNALSVYQKETNETWSKVCEITAQVFVFTEKSLLCKKALRTSIGDRVEHGRWGHARPFLLPRHSLFRYASALTHVTDALPSF
jgi:hypothetical protein